MNSQEPFWLFPQADDIRALLVDAMPPDALPSCFKPQATVVSSSVISPASTPSCLSASSSIDNLAGPLTELAAAAVSTGSTGVADGATGSDRKEGESMFVPSVLMHHFVHQLREMESDVSEDPRKEQNLTLKRCKSVFRIT